MPAGHRHLAGKSRRAGCARPADKDVGAPIYDLSFTTEAQASMPAGHRHLAGESRRAGCARPADKDVGAPIYGAPIYHLSFTIYPPSP
jgi:hypothetical protein